MLGAVWAHVRSKGCAHGFTPCCRCGHTEKAGVRSDPIYEFLSRAAAAADWGLPEEGPVAVLLGLDCADWEPPRFCPVIDILKSARAGGAAPWHNNARPQWDPLPALLSVQVLPPSRCATISHQLNSALPPFLSVSAALVRTELESHVELVKYCSCSVIKATCSGLHALLSISTSTPPHHACCWHGSCGVCAGRQAATSLGLVQSDRHGRNAGLQERCER